MRKPFQFVQGHTHETSKKSFVAWLRTTLCIPYFFNASCFDEVKQAAVVGTNLSNPVAIVRHREAPTHGHKKLDDKSQKNKHLSTKDLISDDEYSTPNFQQGAQRLDRALRNPTAAA